MLTDSHCHLDDYTDLPSVLARAADAGVSTLLAIGIGNGPDEMHRALEIARGHAAETPKLFASAGIHPQEAHRCDDAALQKLSELAADPLCLAIGEIGLDYYHAGNSDVDVQQRAFVAQMQVAAEARKPITLHIRTSELAQPAAKTRFEQHGNPEAAWDDTLRLLREHWQSTEQGSPAAARAGIMHCFSGNAAQCAAALELGFFISFAGNVTYPKSTALADVAKTVPADRLLIETDAPFLTPQPMRGKAAQNEPAFVAHTAAFLAALRGTTAEELAAQTTHNFRKLFRLD